MKTVITSMIHAGGKAGNGTNNPVQITPNFSNRKWSHGWHCPMATVGDIPISQGVATMLPEVIKAPPTAFHGKANLEYWMVTCYDPMLQELVKLWGVDQEQALDAHNVLPLGGPDLGLSHHATIKVSLSQDKETQFSATAPSGETLDAYMEDYVAYSDVRDEELFLSTSQANSIQLLAEVPSYSWLAQLECRAGSNGNQWIPAWLKREDGSCSVGFGRPFGFHTLGAIDEAAIATPCNLQYEAMVNSIGHGMASLDMLLSTLTPTPPMEFPQSLMRHLVGQAYLAFTDHAAATSPWLGPMAHVMPTLATARTGNATATDRDCDNQPPSTPTPFCQMCHFLSHASLKGE
ncbi:unnamed protein product [Cutaneotrichosporon oleaginosum]